MEKGLLFDRVALHYTGVAPGNVQSPASVVANLADTRLALRDGATVTTGETAYPVPVKFLVEFALADILVNDIPQRRHTPQPKSDDFQTPFYSKVYRLCPVFCVNDQALFLGLRLFLGMTREFSAKRLAEKCRHPLDASCRRILLDKPTAKRKPHLKRRA
jgi:hypothetical protein